jgi:2-polyprenyl-3-methyl-5-hydroxy-6-metoxy-1,4-benzoquinol methylase
MSARALPGVDAEWADQSLNYGVQFGGIYDALFPRDDSAVRAADRLAGLAPDPGGRFVEFGVGTGRIALPLAARGVAVTGVDLSPDLLRQAAEQAAESGVALDLVRADIRDWVAPEPADVAYCVCATISMLGLPAEHQRVVDNLTASVRPGGHVVVETHSPARIRLLHRAADTVSFRTPLAGSETGLDTEAHLDPGGRWTVSYRWNDPQPRSAKEFSFLIEPSELAAMARRAGLDPVVTTSSWTGTGVDPAAPTYISVFRKA